MGCKITVQGQTFTSPHNDYASMPPGFTQVGAVSPQIYNGITCNFLKWNDGSTNPVKSVSLTVPATYTAEFKAHLGSTISSATAGNGRKIVDEEYDD